tara:strand:+ start:2304 stop:2495 length:192 start_codon:yes stop_codon:yes gene_type:complete
MNQQYIYFKDLPIKSIFSRNGNQWIKKSMRTAQIVKPIEFNNNWFYFGDRDLCVVGRYCPINL